MSRPPRNPFFRMTVVAGSVFVVTVLSMTAATFGDPDAPPNRFFDRYGMTLIGGETGVLMLTSLIAMTVDRWQTLRQRGRKRDAR